MKHKKRLKSFENTTCFTTFDVQGFISSTKQESLIRKMQAQYPTFEKNQNNKLTSK